MNIPIATFKYKEIEMEFEGRFNNVMVAVNKREEIEIIECQVCV